LLAAATLIAVVGCAMAAASRAAAAPVPTPARIHRMAVAMLGVLNAERRWHRLPPLRTAPLLVLSAHRHNLAMARHNLMSHQLPGEASLARRISRTGYHWRAAGENVGWNADATARGLLSLERQMYLERPPDDGHRVNILSRTFTQVGIDVYYDAAHSKIWFTQDFGVQLGGRAPRA
jgi:uncharacterized protein YkwD